MNPNFRINATKRGSERSGSKMRSSLSQPINRILGALGLSPPQEEKPPPVQQIVRVPVDDEGREIQAR